MEEKYRIPEVRAEVIMETVEGICYKSNGGFDSSETADYIGKGIGYAKRALDASTQLGLTEIKASRFYAVQDAIDISRANREQWPIIFRKFLQRFSPFILFVMLIGKKNSIEEASRKIKVIYNIETSIDIISSTPSSSPCKSASFLTNDTPPPLNFQPMAFSALSTLFRTPSISCGVIHPSPYDKGCRLGQPLLVAARVILLRARRFLCTQRQCK